MQSFTEFLFLSGVLPICPEHPGPVGTLGALQASVPFDICAVQLYEPQSAI